jgi:hypothetical protein
MRWVLGELQPQKKIQDHPGMGWDSCEPINLSLLRLAEKLGAGCRCRQANQNNPYRPNMGIILGTDVSEWKMSTQLEGVLRGKEMVKYSM